MSAPEPDASAGGGRRRFRQHSTNFSVALWCGGALVLLLAVASATNGMQRKPPTTTPLPLREEGPSPSSSDWDFGFAPEGGVGGDVVSGGPTSVPGEGNTASGFKNAAVQRMWGVPDVVAVVGRPFRLDVPRDAFAGQVDRYEVYGPRSSPLPQWLAFTDPKHGRLEGLPGSNDIGELYITIKAVAPSKKGAGEGFDLPEMAKDVFVIEVLPSPPWPSSSNGKGVCVSPLLVSVVLDADFNHLGAQSRARVVGVAASSFLGVPPGSLILRPQLKEDRPDPSDGSVLAAGPGDTTMLARSSKQGSILEWQIGCNGRIWSWKERETKGKKGDYISGYDNNNWKEVNGESVAELRRHARDGSLSDILGLPVVGWRVRRMGANGLPHGTTPGWRARPRVRREWGSGDFENGDDEEEEDGEDDIPKQWAEPWDGDYGFEEKTADRVPETRIIPTMASPVFAEPTAVTIGSMGDSSHPHRHHHGEGEEDDEEEDDEGYGQYAAVASERNVLVTSPVPGYGTILPTPVLSPMRPTRFLSLDEDGSSVEASHFDELAGVIDATPSLSFKLDSSHITTAFSTPSISSSPTLFPTTPSATVDSSDLSPVVTEPLQPTTSKDEYDAVSSSTSTSTEDQGAVSSEDSFETPKSTVPSRPVDREEEVVIDTKNFPPTIHHRLRKIPVTAGNPLRYVIPEDIFTDFEDGNTRNLKVNFKTPEGKPVSSSSWVQFNPDTQEVYALPLEEHVSKWDFIIEAVDREGSAVSDTLELLVQHHKGRRAFHHEFSLVLHLEKKFDFPSDVDWQLRVLDGLRRLFGDDSIVVTAVGHQIPSGDSPSYPDTLVFSWTNDTLPRTDCPKSDIEKLFKILALSDAGEPSVALKDVLSPEFKVKRVSYKGNGQCEGIGAGEEATPTISKQPGKGQTDRGKEDTKPPVHPTSGKSNSPVLRNQVDHINATVGQLLVFRVPEDTFYDVEDGSTRNMKLSLLTMDRRAIPPNNWLQFDPRNQEFFGIPFGPDKGTKEYQLVCEDSSGLSAHDGLVVAVHDIPAITASTRRRPLLPNQQLPTAHSFHSVEFVATLAMTHEQFYSSAPLKRKFVERLAHLFGDRDTSSVLLYSVIAGEDDGVSEDGEGASTLVSWFNTSLPVDKCPDKDVARLRNILVAENGSPGVKEVSLSQHVQTTFGFELPIRSIDIIPINICLGELSVIHFPEPPPVIPDEDEEEGADNGPSSTTSSSSDEYLITFIVPAVVIAAMLLLAGLIACGLYRRRRRGKLSVAEKRAGGGVAGGPLLAGANRGIPVIFQDELEERPVDPAKSPVIMKDEKPPLPLPPPEYQMAPNGGRSTSGPQGGGMMAEPHTGQPLLPQGPRHQGTGGGPRRRGRGRDDGGVGLMHGDEDPGERGALMGGGRGMMRGGDEDGSEDGDRVMPPVGGASSPPYHPPPPFTTNRDSGRGSRPKPTPTYRKPPPYVPP